MKKSTKAAAATLAAFSFFGAGASLTGAILGSKLHDAKKNNFDNKMITDQQELTIVVQEATIKNLRESVEALEEKLVNADYDKAQVEALQSQIEVLKTQISELESQKTAESEEYKQIIDLCNTQIETLTKAVETGAADLDAANTTISTLTTELSELKVQNEKLQEYISNIDNVDTISADINELSEYISSKDEHFAEDRAYVHEEIDDLTDRIDSLKTLGLITNNEHYNLSLSVSNMNKEYIISNIENGVKKYKEADAYTITGKITTNENTYLQYGGYSDTQAYAKVHTYEGENIVSSGYGVIDNDTSKILSNGEYLEEKFNAQDVKMENLDGLVSSVKSDLYNYTTKIEYVASSDRYDIVSETGGYNSPNADTRTSTSYTFDENNDLASFQETYYSFTDSSNNYTSTIDFNTITLEDFAENYNSVYTSLQEEVAKLEQNEEEKE